MIYYWVYHIILFSGRRKLPGLVFLANSGSNRIVFRNSPCHIFLFGDLGYMDSSGSNFRDRTRDSGSLRMFSFIHPLLSRVCMFDPSLQWIQLSHWFAIFDYQSVHQCTTQRSGAKPNLWRSESYGYPHQLLLTSEIDRPSQLCHQLW